MTLLNWLRSRPSTTRRPAGQLRTRLGVHALESREVPAAFASALTVGNDAGNTTTRDVAADAAGNTYTVGHFTGTIDLDPARALPDGADILTSRGGTDAFVAKYAADGSLVWARRMGSADGLATGSPSTGASDLANDVAVDSVGNVYVGGRFTGTADFGPYSGTSAGRHDGFVAKLDAAGAVKWATRWGTAAAADIQGGLGVDAAGNVYTASTATPAFGGVGMNVLKIGANGAVVWDKAVNNVLTGTDVAVDAAGNVVVAGSFQGTVDFDPGSKTKNVSSGASGGSFVLKLTTAGNYAWVSAFAGLRGGGTYGYSAAGSVALDGAGNVVVGGYFGANNGVTPGLVDFNPGSGTTTLPMEGGAYVAKLSGSTGGLAWVRGLATDGSSSVTGLAVDAAGNIYATGYFSGTMDLDPGAGVSARTAAGGQDAFVVKLDAAGTFAWGGAVGGAGNDSSGGIAVDGTGNVFVAGWYQGTADLDPDPLVSYEVTTPGRTRTATWSSCPRADTRPHNGRPRGGRPPRRPPARLDPNRPHRAARPRRDGLRPALTGAVDRGGRRRTVDPRPVGGYANEDRTRMAALVPGWKWGRAEGTKA